MTKKTIGGLFVLVSLAWGYKSLAGISNLFGGTYSAAYLFGLLWMPAVLLMIGIVMLRSNTVDHSVSSTVDHSIKEQKNILQCDNCNYTYDLEDFISDQLFCPDCGSRLNIESK